MVTRAGQGCQSGHRHTRPFGRPLGSFTLRLRDGVIPYPGPDLGWVLIWLSGITTAANPLLEDKDTCGDRRREQAVQSGN
jgi:hypothetical protein